MQWTQWTQYAVHSECSGIVLYGGGDIVFGAKRSNQWMQSHSGHSKQWTQWTQYAVHSECSGIVVYGGGDIVFGAKSSNQWTKWMQYSGCSIQWNSGIWWWGHCL